MMRALCLMVCAIPAAAIAQQGFIPLSRTVDARYTALMHSSKVAAHSSIRPYLREDLVGLEPLDSIPAGSWKPLLTHMTDPANRLYGGPLVDALAGFSAGEENAFKYRTGLGGWIGWNATSRLTLGADVQGWSEALPNYLDLYARASGVTAGEGYAYRSGDAVSHFDWNGYADYKAGEYFHFTLGKGRNFIGEGYRSLFLGDETYGYPYLKITTTAWHLRYVNYFTLMDDIRGAGGDPADFQKKFSSMHYLSWNISKRVNVGLFEAIVWQDNDPKYPRGFDLSYVNPVIFYRPVEFGLGSPDNALLGLAFNVKVGRNAQLYSQLILDEFLLKYVRAGDGWYGNKQGIQVGAVAHDAFRKKGLMLRAEMDYVRPFMYSHTDTRQNFASHGQPLAHPYGSGFLEGLVQGEWRHGRWILGDVFSYAILGRDTTYGAHGSYGNNIFLSEYDRAYAAGTNTPMNFGFYLGEPLQEIVIQNELRAGWLLEPRSGTMLELAWTFRSETAGDFPSLTTNYIRLGISANLHDSHPFQTVRY